MDARCPFPQADWSSPLSGGAQARGSWMLLEGRGLAPTQETLGGGSECGHPRSSCSRRPAPPSKGALPLRQPGVFRCSPGRGHHTPAPSGSPPAPTPVLPAGSDLRAGLPVPEGPPRGGGPIPIPFSFFFFPAWLYGDFLGSWKSEVFPPAFSRCSVRIVPYVDVSLMCLWDLDPTSQVPHLTPYPSF